MACPASVPFWHLQVYWRVVWWTVSFKHSECSAYATYVVAVVAVAGDLALAAADVDASVGVGLAPQGTLSGVDQGWRDGAARDGGVQVGVVLSRRQAGKGRGGDDESGVEHGCCCG